jgi:hypothetical protein
MFKKMSGTEDFKVKLQTALEARARWIEHSELPKLKDEFRAFHTSLSALYGMFVKKGYITEDPYKADAKSSAELQIPDTGAIVEAGRRDQIGQRLSQLDNEMDYIPNFYQFSLDNFTQDKIKILLGLVKYVDWTRLSPESGPVTEAVAAIITSIRRATGDAVSVLIVNESVIKLERSTFTISSLLKTISDYNRELWKYSLRSDVISALSGKEANIVNIKAKFGEVYPAQAFYQPLAEEVLREDYSQISSTLQDKVLKTLAVAGESPRPRQKANYRTILIEGLNAVGSAGATLNEIYEKLMANHQLMGNRKRGFWEKLAKLVTKITGKDDEYVFYDIDYIDPVKGAAVMEKLNFTLFCSEIEKKSKILSAVAVHGSAEKKLLTMEEPQLIEILQRNIKDINTYHKLIGALDEFFKENVDRADRGKVKGVKPELSAIKNASSRGSQKIIEYNAHKDEVEKFKKLGVEVDE